MDARVVDVFELWNRGGWPKIDVMGEKFHQKEIRSLFPGGATNGWAEYSGLARLVPEPHNPHDPNAVSVRVEGHLIGYLAKEQAARYAGVLTRLMTNGRVPVTACQVRAHEYDEWRGSDRRGRDVYESVLDAHASIVLDEPHLCVPVNLPPSTPHRMLPHGSALQVRGEEEHLDVLAPLVREHGEAWVFATLAALTVGTGKSEKRLVEIRVDGSAIGQLTPAMSAHFLTIIDHLADSGLCTAAKLLLKGNPLQVEAILHASKGHELASDWFGSGDEQRAPGSTRNSSLGTDNASTDWERSPETETETVTPAAPVDIPPKPTKILFQVPPGWPPAPDGWEPVPGWRPDDNWPPPPDGWIFWVAR